jgi:hypothetical protein
MRGRFLCGEASDEEMIEDEFDWDYSEEVE